MILESLKSQLIVSCQAPSDSPLHQPQMIAAIAMACCNQGCAGVRIDTPAHIKAVKKLLPSFPVIGLWKREYHNSPVYITPTSVEVKALIEADADIIAIDATLRTHPQETVEQLVRQIHQAGKLVMADIDSVESAIAASDLDVDLIATTLYGYTSATQHLSPPGFSLLEELQSKLTIPLICEGGIASPEMAHQALANGAYAVVVGKAITGIDQKVQDFCSYLGKKSF